MNVDLTLLALGRGVVVVSFGLFAFWSFLFVVASATRSSEDYIVPPYRSDPWGWRAVMWTFAGWVAVGIAVAGYMTRTLP